MCGTGKIIDKSINQEEQKVQKQTHTYMVTWCMTEEYCTELGKVGKTESTGYPNEKKNVSWTLFHTIYKC